MNRVVAARLYATSLAPAKAFSIIPFPPLFHVNNRRPFSTPWRHLSTNHSPDPPPLPPLKNRLRRDEEIPHTRITFINENGKLFRNVYVKNILKTMDRTAFFLVEVDPNVEPPVCRLFSKKIVFDKQKAARKKHAPPPERVTKEIQFSWAVSEHDMSHKLSRAQQFLERGNTLHIEISPKKDSPKTSPATQAQMIEKVKQRLMECARLAKEPVINKGQAMLVFEPKGLVGRAKANEENDA
ncbi:hypothetical protein BC936DRAFT_136596 [Jimgerdemannia flammicorona]|uniref:Translation initiation factor 3 N-terminal domain-containing protein n=1 Tax=Jimgerdemannia flammicorona TaxID=994334 RepID=A0A433DJY1_9FUNG|nr:hypothetical protein BC936DRAFT_136596 [Jimgerdemannia flammicorona]